MEKDIILTTPDGYNIYGTLTPTGSKRLIIFVHGLTGRRYEHQYLNAVPFFTARGFDIFRFDFYARGSGARSLRESSLRTHAADMNTILEYIHPMYEDIILVGHSLGAIVLLQSDLTHVSRIVLRDPTTRMKSIEDKKGEYNPHLDAYIVHRGIDIIIGKEMVQDWGALDEAQLIARMTKPCKFIFAGNYNKQQARQPYLTEIPVEHSIASIAGASHGFIEEGTEQKLFEETFIWIQ